ncbi:MAG: hypothetical protein KGJ87_05260 [Planctomycetota bacterium]|nr:hypothetical protein [Planctomycetota bacterium]
MYLFLMQALDLGGVWSFNVPEIIPGETEFNFFITIVMVFGLVSIPVGALVRLISRS